MFSRLKGAFESHIGDIDSQLQQEARTRTSAIRRSNSPANNRSPSRARTASTSALSREKELRDPSEFENESDGSTLAGTPPRIGTPIQGEAVTEDPLGAVGGGVGGVGGAVNTEKKDTPRVREKTPESRPATPAGGSSLGASSSNMDLPTDVRVKLRKLEKIEAKHGGMNYTQFGCGKLESFAGVLTLA